MTTTSYYTGIAADLEELLAEIETAAAAGGWTTSIGAFPGGTGPDAGDLLVMDIGAPNEYTLRTYADLKESVDPTASGYPNISGAGMSLMMAYTDGSNASVPPILITDSARAPEVYIGAQPTTSEGGGDYVNIVFPFVYHIFVYTQPDMIAIVIQSGTIRYQWMMFGEIVKFGTWVGGGFYGASGCTMNVAPGGPPSAVALYDRNDESAVRSFAPWFRMWPSSTRGQRASPQSNTRLHIITGTSESGIDDFDWTFCQATNPGFELLRECIANKWWLPLADRSPNTHNEVSVMLPYWLATQRESHRVLIGRQPHIRHIPMQNFNPGDVFDLHGDEWIVFPYFEREGLTALDGMALRRNSGS